MTAITLDLRSEIRSQIALGVYDARDIVECLFRLHGREAVDEMARELAPSSYELVLAEARKQIQRARRNADRESESQKRLRQQRYRDDLALAGLIAPDGSIEDAYRVDASVALHARLNLAIESFRKQTISEFLTDLLVPQVIPGGKTKRRYDLTADDCVAISRDYEKRAVTESGMAYAFASFAEAITEQGVAVLGEVNLEALLERAA